MKKNVFAIAVAGALVGASGCDVPAPLDPMSRVDGVAMADGGPADGNGHKRVIVFSFESTITCPNGTQLTRVIDGWVQFREFGEGSSRTVELDVFHRTFTFTNAAGDRYKEQDVGPERYWVEDGQLFVSTPGRIVGRHVGMLVVNLDTGETVFEAGQDLEPPRIEACRRLT